MWPAIGSKRRRRLKSAGGGWINVSRLLILVWWRISRSDPITLIRIKDHVTTESVALYLRLSVTFELNESQNLRSGRVPVGGATCYHPHPFRWAIDPILTRPMILSNCLDKANDCSITFPGFFFRLFPLPVLASVSAPLGYGAREADGHQLHSPRTERHQR
jgi:hypothetical protein